MAQVKEIATELSCTKIRGRHNRLLETQDLFVPKKTEMRRNGALPFTLQIL